MRAHRKWKARAWARDRRCHWCRRETIFDIPVITKLNRSGNLVVIPQTHLRDALATVDHLRDRYDPSRREPCKGQEQRRVLACWRCNNDRNTVRQAELRATDIGELHRRSGKL